MAGPFFVDDGGDGSTGDSWATADTSINALDAEYAFASGEIVYFGADHVCQASNSANLYITGPTSGLPVQFISSTVGSGTTVSYAKSSSNQIDTSEGAYDVLFDGSFALIGMCIKSGNHIWLGNDADEPFAAYDCTFRPASNRYISLCNTGGASVRLLNCTVDCTADTSGAKTSAIFSNGVGSSHIHNLKIENAANRTGPVFTAFAGSISGVDLTGCSNAAGVSIFSFGSTSGHFTRISNVLTAATWAPFSGTAPPGGACMITNAGPADAPESLYYACYEGNVASSAIIYRTGGASVEGVACSWLITTTATCAEVMTLYTPWIYGAVSSTGSKTFTAHITNDTADFTNAEVWLEVEYLKDADEANWTLATDQRATITTTPAAQTDDTTSVWVGLNDDSQGLADYMQSLAVTATIGETGQYRARVAVGVASIAASRYFYIDPKITVS